MPQVMLPDHGQETGADRIPAAGHVAGVLA
jgi:hypothetical protein